MMIVLCDMISFELCHIRKDGIQLFRERLNNKNGSRCADMRTRDKGDVFLMVSFAAVRDETRGEQRLRRRLTFIRFCRTIVLEIAVYNQSAKYH